MWNTKQWACEMADSKDKNFNDLSSCVYVLHYLLNFPEIFFFQKNKTTLAFSAIPIAWDKCGFGHEYSFGIDLFGIACIQCAFCSKCCALYFCVHRKKHSIIWNGFNCPVSIVKRDILNSSSFSIESNQIFVHKIKLVF